MRVFVRETFKKFRTGITIQTQHSYVDSLDTHNTLIPPNACVDNFDQIDKN